MSNRSVLVFALFAAMLAWASSALAQDPRYGGGPGYDNGYADSVDCKSYNYSYQRCPVRWRDARIVRQLSDTPCRRGQNWGLDRQGLWVDRGCAGRFVDAYGGGGGWRPPSGWDHNFQMRCQSSGYQYGFCAVDVGRGGRVYLQRQLSNSPCVEGRTWGWNRAGVWVDQGCEGIFTIDRRWH